MSTPVEETKATADAVQGASEETDKPVAMEAEEQTVKQDDAESSAPAAADADAAEEGTPAPSDADSASAPVKAEEESSTAAGNEADTAEKSESADAAANGVEDKSKQELGLGSAAMKRYKWLLKNDHTPEEALALARKPTTQSANKRKASGNANGDSATKVSRSSDVSMTMAVTCKDYPSSSLTSAQCKQVKSAILKQVVQQKDSELKPHFQSCTFGKGYLRVECADQKTREWLHRVLSKLEFWDGGALKAVAERNLIRAHVFSGQFDDSSDDNDKAILEFIQSQNDGLKTGKWKVINRKDGKSKNSVELTFSVDLASARAIEKLNSALNYKFNAVKLTKHEKPAPLNRPSGPGGRQSGPGGRQSGPGGRQGSSLRRSGPPMRRPGAPVQQQQQQRQTSFVPIWDTNFPQNRGGNFIQEPVRNNSFNGNSSAGSGNWNNSSSNPLDAILGLSLLSSVNPAGGGIGNNNWSSGGNSYSSSGDYYGGGRSSSGGNSFNRGNYSSGGRRNNSSGGGNRSNNRPPRSSGGGAGGGGGGNSLYDQLRAIGRTPGGSSGNGSGNPGQSNGGRNRPRGPRGPRGPRAPKMGNRKF